MQGTSNAYRPVRSRPEKDYTKTTGKGLHCEIFSREGSSLGIPGMCERREKAWVGRVGNGND